MTADELFRTLKRAVAGSFEVLAELGRGQAGRNAFVAREVDGGGLVVLELILEDSDAEGAPNYGLYIRRELDASIPALSLQCDRCGASLSGWARYCPGCENDVSGVAQTTGGRSTADLMRNGQLAGHDRYEFLGEMPRAEGGGGVYFARERATGNLVALKVEREVSGPEAGYRLDTTQRMAALPQQGTSATPPQQPKVAWRGGEARTVASPASAGPATSPADAGPATSPAPAAEAGTPSTGGSGGFCPTCGATYETGIWFCPRDGSPIRPSVVTDRLIGQMIAGKYRVVRKLGSGGMGTVYLAEQFAIGRPCALKIMNPSLRDDPEALGRFARKAAHASRITHPNVAVIYDYGESTDGMVYLAMEFADGESLGALMKREGAVAAERAGEIICQVLDALAAAHAIGIVHRDLKPDNIILASTPSGKHAVKVVDFGIAKAMQSSESQQLTRTGFVVGTPKYMSPEQITGGAIDGRSDIYSADCILYELLVGAVPFSGPSGEITITRRLTEPPPHPRRLNRSVGRRLDRVVVRAMARERDQRYRTAEEFRHAVAEATRPDFTNAWEQRWGVVSGGFAEVRQHAADALSNGGRGLQAGVRAVGAGWRRPSAQRASCGAPCARCFRGKLPPPLPCWRCWGRPPTVLDWLSSRSAVPASPAPVPAGAERRSASPPGDVGAGDPARGSVARAAGFRGHAVAASTSPAAAGRARSRPAVASRLAFQRPGALRCSSRRGGPVRGRHRFGSGQLRLVGLLREEEAYAEAFDQLRLVRSRLDALRASYPEAEAVRQLRAQLTQVQSATTSQCDAARRVAIQLGETPPVCR
jgi:predicted Ser/Thr protein kinase